MCVFIFLIKVTEWPPIGKIAAHSAYDMFHGISAWLLVWFFPTSVFGVGISFWLRLFLIFAYLYFFIGINDFSFQFRKIITRYRRIGYNLNVMRQSACLVFNPIMVDNYAAFFNCTPVGRASDSMMAPT